MENISEYAHPGAPKEKKSLSSASQFSLSLSRREKTSRLLRRMIGRHPARAALDSSGGSATQPPHSGFLTLPLILPNNFFRNVPPCTPLYPPLGKRHTPHTPSHPPPSPPTPPEASSDFFGFWRPPKQTCTANCELGVYGKVLQRNIEVGCHTKIPRVANCFGTWGTKNGLVLGCCRIWHARAP